MFNNGMTKFAAGFGLAFLLMHIAYIGHIVQPESISDLYIFFWKIYIIFFGLSIVYIIHHLVMKFLKHPKPILPSILPLLINITVIMVLYGVTLSQSRWHVFS